MSKNANVGWLGLAAYVVVYDIWAMKHDHETLSSACYRAYKHPVGRYIVLTGVSVTLKHLFAPNFMPKVDPYGIIALAIRGTKKVVSVE